MFLRVNSSVARMSCERREQTPEGRDGAEPASQFKRSANELRAEGADPEGADGAEPASQFKRSANELRTEGADHEGARRGEARESTLICMQEGRRFFRRTRRLRCSPAVSEEF